MPRHWRKRAGPRPATPGERGAGRGAGPGDQPRLAGRRRPAPTRMRPLSATSLGVEEPFMFCSDHVERTRKNHRGTGTLMTNAGNPLAVGRAGKRR